MRRRVTPEPAYPLVHGLQRAAPHHERRSVRAGPPPGRRPLVEPGGRLVLVEPILFDAAFAKPYDPKVSSRARPLETYEAPLLASGLERVNVRPRGRPCQQPDRGRQPGSASPLSPVVELVRRLPRAPEPPLVALARAATAHRDRVAMASGAAPSSKLAIYRRPPG